MHATLEHPFLCAFLSHINFLVTCYNSLFIFFPTHLVSSCLHNIPFLPNFPSLSCCLLPRHVSPLSLLFFALSDMSQGSSDEESEEEEDFARVQFGSRYTAARCVHLCVLAQLQVHCMFQWAQKA